VATKYVFNVFTGNLDIVTGDHDHTEAGDGGVLTNDVHDGYSDYAAISTPSNPTQDTGRIFTRLDGSNTAVS